MQGKPIKVIETSIGKMHVYESSEAKVKDIDNLYELMIRLLMEEVKDQSVCKDQFNVKSHKV